MDKKLFPVSVIISVLLGVIAVVTGRSLSENIEAQGIMCSAAFFVLFPAVNFIFGCIAGCKQSFLKWLTPVLPALISGVSPLLIFNSSLNSDNTGSFLMGIALVLALGFVGILVGSVIRKKKQSA